MAISYKKVSGRKYAYLVVREGDRLIQTYLGPVDDPHVSSLIQKEKDKKKLPESIKKLFWETDPEQVDLKKHASSIIRKVLEFGSLKDLNWLEVRYGLTRILVVLETSKGLSLHSKEFFKIWYSTEVSFK